MRFAEWHALLHFVWRENLLYWVARRVERHTIHRWFSDLALVLVTALVLWLVAVGLMSLMQGFPMALWGTVLFEITAWCHLLVNISTFHTARALKQFEKRLGEDLLLTRTSPLWFLLASLPNFLRIRTYFSIIFLPFYITAFTWGGYGWTTLLTVVLFLTLVYYSDVDERTVQAYP